MVLENVPRIRAPSAERFFSDWVRPALPVILTDLFDTTPLRRVDTLDRARRELARVPLLIQPNYLSFLETGSRGDAREMSLCEYLEQVERDPNTRDLCVEFASPEALRAELPAPAYAELEAPDDVVSATFLANAGNYNHLHFDDDQRHVLLYQVFGTKRFSVISPEHGRKLDAFLVFDPALRRAVAQTPARDANGRVYLHTFPGEAAKEAFLAYAGAADCTLRAGETLFMPALAWHYVEYLETSLSVTFRLGRHPLSRGLSETFAMPSVLVQELGSRLANLERFGRAHPALRDELETLLAATTPASVARRLRAEAFVTKAYEASFSCSPNTVLAARELYHRELAGRD
nr:hypothetical protein Hi04_10k_c5591_00002 [uncultured bacterium]